MKQAQPPLPFSEMVKKLLLGMFIPKIKDWRKIPVLDFNLFWISSTPPFIELILILLFTNLIQCYLTPCHLIKEYAKAKYFPHLTSYLNHSACIPGTLACAIIISNVMQR